MVTDPTAWKYRFKLSKGSLILLHLVAANRIERVNGRWVARTHHSNRDVTLRVNKMVNTGVLSATFEQPHPQLTEWGRRYLADHPLEDVLNIKVIR